MVKTLTEDELCELAEIRNRLAQLLFSADASQVSEKDLLYSIILDVGTLGEFLCDMFEVEETEVTLDEVSSESE